MRLDWNSSRGISRWYYAFGGLSLVGVATYLAVSQYGATRELEKGLRELESIYVEQEQLLKETRELKIKMRLQELETKSPKRKDPPVRNLKRERENPLKSWPMEKILRQVC
jgi:hypothetical protein